MRKDIERIMKQIDRELEVEENKSAYLCGVIAFVWFILMIAISILTA